MMTMKETRKATADLMTALNSYSKRTKHITEVRAHYFYGYVRIDVHAPKSSGKIYNEMVEYLNKVLPYSETDNNASHWYSHDEHTRDNDLVADSEVEINVCVYHW